MDIKPADIADMQKLYKKHFGIELDYDTAYRKLTMLVRQMELVYQPITKKQADAIHGSDEEAKKHKD